MEREILYNIFILWEMMAGSARGVKYLRASRPSLNHVST